MEPVEVTARFGAQGRIIPISFTLGGQTYSVDSIGRRWLDDEGQHILVMVPGDRVFELIFESEQMRWFLKRVGFDRTLS